MKITKEQIKAAVCDTLDRLTGPWEANLPVLLEVRFVERGQGYGQLDGGFDLDYVRLAGMKEPPEPGAALPSVTFDDFPCPDFTTETSPGS